MAIWNIYLRFEAPKGELIREASVVMLPGGRLSSRRSFRTGLVTGDPRMMRRAKTQGARVVLMDDEHVRTGPLAPATR